MSAKKDLSESGMEFSRNYWCGPFLSERALEHPWSTRTKDRRDGGTLPQGRCLAGSVPRAAWQGWSDRGIPELASPLAD